MAIENNDLATIKKPNQVEYISKEQLIERLKEIKRCREDIIYFCENYYRIQSLDKGLHIVKLYDVQKELLKFMVDNNRVICLSPRQGGKSSTYCMYTLWLTCFRPDKKILMLAQRESTALELLDRIKTGYEYLPTWLKPGCVEFNKSSISFSNRSSIKGMASGSDSARGTTVNVLILDEFAFLNKSIADKLFTSVYPVVSSSKNGKVIIVSTPNGKNNLYYDLWKKANNKNDPDNIDGWTAFRMDWWQIPGRDEKWKQGQLAAIGPTRFAQEFNNEFLDDVTTSKLISDDTADKFRIQLSEFKQKGIHQGKQLFISSPDKSKTYTFTMYHDFDPRRTYLASGDVAEGIGKDSSVLYVWDVTDLSNIRLCCKFSDNRTSILEFAYVTNEILKLYANPFFACESNGIALGYIEQLRVTYQYQNFVRMNKGGCGIDSHFQLKTRACLWCRDMLTTVGFGFELYDADLIDEFSSFIKKDGTTKHIVYQAIKGAHDDHIMPLIWMCWILNPENVEKYYDVVDTFNTSTGVVFPKVLHPQYGYLESEILNIQNNPLNKDFQIYKMKNNNGFLLANDDKDSDKIHLNSDVNSHQIVENFNNKTVLSENEIVQFMRMQSGKNMPMTKAQNIGGSSDRGLIFMDEIKPTIDSTNVVWSNFQNYDGIDNLFGFDDDNGLTW